MARLKQVYESNGFYGIGVMHCSSEENIGTLWRSAFIMGASFIFTVGKKYEQQGSDVTNAWSKIPLYHYETIEELKNNLPYATPLVAVELDDRAVTIEDYNHPIRAAYLLGSEGCGLSKKVMDETHSVIKLPGYFSLNVAVAGSILLYDRVAKMGGVLPK